MTRVLTIRNIARVNWITTSDFVKGFDPRNRSRFLRVSMGRALERTRAG